MLVVCSKPVKEVLTSLNAEGIGVLCEVAVLEHVVNVIPNDLDRYSKFAVVVHYLFSLAPILVALDPSQYIVSKPCEVHSSVIAILHGD